MDFLYVAVLVCLCVCVLVAMCVAVHRTEIVSSFDRLHRRRQYRVQINRSVSAFHIASRVMRKDNYLIALMNKNMLDLSLPCCCRCSVPLTKTLEWNLHWTMLNHMFDVPTFQLRPEFLNDVPALQRRFVVFGILNFVLLPFTLLLTEECSSQHSRPRFHCDRTAHSGIALGFGGCLGRCGRRRCSVLRFDCGVGCLICLLPSL